MRYADTSWLRAAKAGDVSGVQTTSALTFIELLNGIGADDDAYRRRRSAITRSLQTTVIWTMPDELFCTCFEEFRNGATYTEQRIGPLRDLLATVERCEERAAFIKAEAELPHEWKLEAFNEFDDNFAGYFRDTTTRSNISVRKAFDDAKANPSSHPSIPSDILTGSFQRFCTWFRDSNTDLNISSTLHGLCTMVAGMCGRERDERFVEALYRSYDGSRDVFLRGFSYACMSMMADMTTTGRNDELDLAHLLYLGSDDVLLTCDTKLSEIASAIGLSVSS